MPKAPQPKPEPDPPEPPEEGNPDVNDRREAALHAPPRQQLTFGEKAVGLTFNPSGDPIVNQLKQLYARIIDLCDEQRTNAMSTRIASQPSEQARLWSIAITEAQGGQMWAVKAATWRD